jgi:hypothetical protein
MRHLAERDEYENRQPKPKNASPKSKKLERAIFSKTKIAQKEDKNKILSPCGARTSDKSRKFLLAMDRAVG